jgi:hypothetical protein
MSGTSSYVNRWAYEDSATPTFDSGSETWDWREGSDFIKTQPILNATGLMGTRRKDESRTRFAPYSVSASQSCEPSPLFLATWLFRAMGGGSIGSPSLADALPVFGSLQDKGGDVYQYLGCKASKLKLSGKAGGLVDCTVDIIGKSEDTTVTSFVGAALPSGDSASEPFQHADLVLTLAGSARKVLDFDFELNNNCKGRFVNSLTADEIMEGERLITLSGTSVFSSTEAGNLYGLTKEGAAGSLVLTNGTVSVTLTFARVQIPDNSARSQGGEIILPFQAQVRGTALGAEFTATIDSTE